MAPLRLLIVSVWLVVCMDAVPPRYTYIPGFGSYRIVTERKEWGAAEVDCESDGDAGLAVINSPEESRALKKLIRETSGAGVKVHVGFQDQDGNGQFQTVLKGELSDTGFNEWKMPPSNASEGMCGAMWMCGRLGESTCDTVLAYICEHFGEPEAV